MISIGRTAIVEAYRRVKPWLEALEQQHEAQETASITRGLVPLAAFLMRLADETTRAERYQREFALVVLHVPTSTKRQARELDIALRDCLRKADVPARLSESVLAVLLPETGAGVATAAGRIATLLSGVAGSPVTSGFACYPGDAQKSSDLMRIAADRSDSERHLKTSSAPR
jgi:GGDEF domain-containing protein